jgi:hypothetical protein
MKTQEISKQYTIAGRQKIIFILYTAYCLLFFFNFVLAQSPQPVFRHYTTDDGLSSSEVYCAIQDSKGYLWFATNMGVCRYDGYRFRVFTKKDGLPDNTVFNIHEDHKGRIWFVPFTCRLSWFENEKIHEYPYNDSLQKRLKGNSIWTSFYVDKHDTIYFIMGISNSPWTGPFPATATPVAFMLSLPNVNLVYCSLHLQFLTGPVRLKMFL